VPATIRRHAGDLRPPSAARSAASAEEQDEDELSGSSASTRGPSSKRVIAAIHASAARKAATKPERIAGSSSRRRRNLAFPGKSAGIASEVLDAPLEDELAVHGEGDGGGDVAVVEAARAHGAFLTRIVNS
jgi:hypothetical protein